MTEDDFMFVAALFDQPVPIHGLSGVECNVAITHQATGMTGQQVDSIELAVPSGVVVLTVRGAKTSIPIQRVIAIWQT
jgi:hypothetical protein